MEKKCQNSDDFVPRGFSLRIRRACGFERELYWKDGRVAARQLVRLEDDERRIRLSPKARKQAERRTKSTTMYFVYILKSTVSGKIYTGSTNDLSARVKRHNSGRVQSTKAFAPYEVVYSEEYATLSEARKREFFLKSGLGRHWLKEKLEL